MIKLLYIVTLCLMMGRVLSQDAVNCVYTSSTAIEYKPNYYTGYTNSAGKMVF